MSADLTRLFIIHFVCKAWITSQYDMLYPVSFNRYFMKCLQGKIDISYFNTMNRKISSQKTGKKFSTIFILSFKKLNVCIGKTQI